MPDWFIRIVQMFNQQPDIRRMGFLSSFFTVRPESFTDANTFTIDIIRGGEEIAPTVRDLSTGAIVIVNDQFTNKEFDFPVYALESAVNIAELMTRQPGENAYITERVNWMGRLSNILIDRFSKMTDMIRRSIEYQAAQVLQTGTITLTDENGRKTFELDLKPKATHFPSVTTAWSDGTNATPLEDIDALAEMITADGQCDVTNLVFGAAAWKNFIKNSEVLKLLDKGVMNVAALDPRLAGRGAKRMGYIDYAAHRYELWLYNANYNLFGDTAIKKYLDPANVLFLPSIEDLDFRRKFGGIPIIRPDPIFDAMFGGKIQIEGEYDFRSRVRYDDRQETYIGEIKSRPLCLPVSIDRYGCLKTEIV